MSPALLLIHQEILSNVHYLFRSYFEGKSCKVIPAPFDVVRLPKGDEADISIICDRKKLDRRGCKGAPDLIVEIVSPGNAAHDLTIKHRLYEKNGVKEYWIVLPREQIIEVYSLTGNNTYGRPGVFGPSNSIKTDLFPDLEIDLTKIFEQEEAEHVREKRL
jgi:Uma2 family endonuclease